MTTVPVLWVSLHSEILSRGYADQALLESILDRSLWRPPGELTFEHYEVRDAPFTVDGGAVVVIPSRHHANDIELLVQSLESLEWSVVLLTSEEEWMTDWRRIAKAADHIWVWQARPEHGDCDGLMPCGWNPGTREGLVAANENPVYEGRRLAVEERELDWYFAGQITHQRRRECFAAMKQMITKGEHFAKGRLVETDHYLAGYADNEGEPHDVYLANMARAKLVPCPSGPMSLCTARVEEALEAGCVPILDLVKPEDPQFDYWKLIFGDGHPMPTLYDWNELPGEVEAQLAKWPANANRCWSFWQQWKRRMAHRLDNNIRLAAGLNLGDDLTAPNDLITVIVTSSPAPLHPSTEHIEVTIDSIRAQLPDAEIVVACDGVRPEQEHLAGRYEAYLHRLFWLTNFHWHNVVPIRSETWQHQAGMVRRALDAVTTPLILFVEHDTPLVGPIDWEGICGLVMSGEANMVEFREDTEIHEAHEPLMVDHETRIVRGVPVRRTADYRQRPHVAQTRLYRDRIMPGFTEKSRAMVEDTMYGVVSNAYHEHGEAGWFDWRIWAYTPDEMTDPPLGHKRHRHIDSRGDEPKGDTDILPIEGFR